MEAFLRRHEVTPVAGVPARRGEPCEHCGAVRRTASERQAPVITRETGYITRAY